MTALASKVQEAPVKREQRAKRPSVTDVPVQAKFSRTEKKVSVVISKEVESVLVVAPVMSEADTVKDVHVQYWEDLDKADMKDPLMVAEYVVEIFQYLRSLELTTKPDPNYIKDQAELTWKMRSVLVDWLIEVHNKFHLLPETLYLAINILDRFLSHRVVSLVKLQLVGITALFVASKYEEVVHPSVKNFIYLADNGYTEKEVFKSEVYLLSVIEFQLHYPNPMNFLRRISKAESYDLHSRTLAKYLMEVTLLDEKFIGIAPSLVAAGGAYLARQMLGRSELWVSFILIPNSHFIEQQSHVLLW